MTPSQTHSVEYWRGFVSFRAHQMCTFFFRKLIWNHWSARNCIRLCKLFYSQVHWSRINVPMWSTSTNVILLSFNECSQSYKYFKGNSKKSQTVENKCTAYRISQVWRRANGTNQIIGGCNSSNALTKKWKKTKKETIEMSEKRSMLFLW